MSLTTRLRTIEERLASHRPPVVPLDPRVAGVALQVGMAMMDREYQRRGMRPDDWRRLSTAAMDRLREAALGGLGAVIERLESALKAGDATLAATIEAVKAEFGVEPDPD